MKLALHPMHEAVLAGALMVVALLAMAGIVAHDYAGRLSPGVVDDMYQTPILSIRAADRRITSLLAAHIPLGNLDELYEERRLLPPTSDTGDDEVAVSPSDASKGVGPPRLTGIAWSNRRPIAFLNGRGVMIGQSVEGWRVTGIGRQSVTLLDEKGTQEKIELY